MAQTPSPDEARARAYHRRQLVLSLLGLALSVTYLVALIETGAAARLSVALARWTRAWWLELAIATLVLAAGYRVLTLPLAWLGGYWLPRRFGLLHQPFHRWLWDAAKAALLGGVLGLLAVEIVYGLLRLTPWWWLWGAAAFVAGYALLALVAPIWLVPLFYRLTPLPDGPLRARLLALAGRVGVPVTGVFVVDQSRKSRTANAAVTGLGRTRRILLFDTLLAEFTPEEVEAVLAHELAHQLHGDIRRGVLVQGTLTLFTFWVADVALRLGTEWLGLEGPADIGGLPLFGLVVVLASLVALPLANGWSRHIERRADQFALRTIADPRAFIASMERLAALNLAEREPHPLEEFLLYSHPSIGRRIAYARQFRHSMS
ncbi:MAG TPA: M48 family metallopeptidase [Methylomirabilota bacterium]|nr:M48 family metallopeptidase [Methylomirabilota bacterium]HSF03453.1 M48 family metallopeptidase [Solirubrobacterales bacterium]